MHVFDIHFYINIYEGTILFFNVHAGTEGVYFENAWHKLKYFGLFLPHNFQYMQVAISKDDSVILDGAGDKKAIEERCEQVCVLHDLTAFSAQLSLLNERYVKIKCFGVHLL